MAKEGSKIRIVVKGDKPGSTRVITTDPNAQVNFVDTFPAKEWCINDDVLNISDAASVGIANDDGETSGKFQIGERVEFHLSDPGVQNGAWLPQLTGRITGIQMYSDIMGGSNIQLNMQDLGWHLTSSHGKPFDRLLGVTFKKLLELVIDPSWGFAPTDTTHGNKLNRTLKQGRIGVQRAFAPQFGAILPLIQIEPGQAPFEILSTYAKREGVLINVGAKGELVLFRPDYSLPTSYKAIYHRATESTRTENNVIGRPMISETIDGYYSEVQCFSTVVIPLVATGLPTDNPNENYTRTTFRPSKPEDLPPFTFARREVFSDAEAISATMRKNRATWKYQMGRFTSWQYECEVPAHSQNGSFFTSDTMIEMQDTVHKVVGGHYVQSVKKSDTMQQGVRSKLTIRKPRLLDPTLTIQTGGGAKIPQKIAS